MSYTLLGTKIRFFIYIFILCICSATTAQVSYSSAAAYSMRKIIPSYTGNAIQVRRTCDNAIKDIGFTSCGELDTATLKTFVVASNPLSSITSTAAAAYSLRKLSCSYSGNAIQVRRSDGVLQNIGFNSVGDLDTNALKAFIGSSSGFVATWYDQSGNGRDATQATTTLQPRIVNAGLIERQNGMPAIRWLGLGYALKTASFTAYGTAACFNAVAKVNTATSSGYSTTVNKCSSNFPAPLDLYNGTIVIGTPASYNFYAMSQTFNAASAYAIWTYQASAGGSVNAYKNSTSICTGTVTASFGDSGTPLTLGSRADNLTGLNGWLSEVITFAVIPSTTDRAFLEWTQGQYYNLSGAPALGTIPVGAQSGYIVTWYDQSGGAAHATQATNGNQGRIVNVGVIEKNGTKSALRFGGSSQNLTVATPVTSYPASISVIGNTSGGSTNGAFVKLGGTTIGSSGIGIGVGAAGTDFDNSGTSLIGLKEFQVWCPSSPTVNFPATPFTVTEIQQNAAAGNTLSAFLNGTTVPLSSSTNITDGTTITGNLFIGGYANGTNRFPVVKESEVVVFGSALSTTRRRLLECNQAAYYNISISNNKYTPPGANSYSLFVNGVGRESASDSVTATRASGGMGFIVGQTASDFLKSDGDYMTCGMNCPLYSCSTLNLPVGVTQRWSNDWYINKTDVGTTNGNISLYFDFTDYAIPTALPGVASNYVFMTRTTPAGTFSIIAGMTPTVVGDRVIFTGDASNIINNQYYTIGTRNSTLSPLPIELVEFKAEVCEKEVCLTWTTASEKSNDFFTIEKTKDGNLFDIVTTINGAGNSTSNINYAAIDHAPYEGISYYRLKQTDFDGLYSYSNLQEVNFENISNFSIDVFPNPNSGEAFNLTINTKEQEKIALTLYDATGKELYSKLIFTYNKTENNYTINLPKKLAPGIYCITATSQQNFYSQKLIVK